MSTLRVFGAICSRCLKSSERLFGVFRHVSKETCLITTRKNFSSHRTSSFKMMMIDRLSNCQGSRNVLSSTRSLGARFYSPAAGIQKHVSALVAKRPVRRKIPHHGKTPKAGMEVTAYAVAEELNLSQLLTALQTQGLYNTHELPPDVTNGIYVQAKYAVDSEVREIFFFSEGSAVFWNVPEVERREVIKFTQKHSMGRYEIPLVIHESEYMPFKISEEQTGLVGEIINICDAEAEEGMTSLEKYTFSNALSQAVNLGMWEAALERFVDLIEPITEDLRDGKKIRMSRREVLRRTGELFALRHVINLSSDLLDTPDFYWDREALESLYQKACNHLNIARRTRVMNERLSHLCELMELLSTHLNDTHHTRLEWMIIILIMVEVVFEIVHYIERYLDSHQEPYPAEPTQTSQADS